jgi:hypothetical protein
MSGDVVSFTQDYGKTNRTYGILFSFFLLFLFSYFLFLFFIQFSEPHGEHKGHGNANMPINNFNTNLVANNGISPNDKNFYTNNNIHTSNDKNPNNTYTTNNDFNTSDYIGSHSNPVIFRIRHDLVWEDVLNLHNPIFHSVKGTPVFFSLFPIKLINSGTPARTLKPKFYWKKNHKKNMKVHLENAIINLGLDPNDPESWYQLSSTDFKNHRVRAGEEIAERGEGGRMRESALFEIQEARIVLKHYKRDIRKAARDLFPHLNLDISKFAKTPSIFLSSILRAIRFPPSKVRVRGKSEHFLITERKLLDRYKEQSQLIEKVRSFAWRRSLRP